MKKRTKADKAFICGYAIAVAEIVRMHDEPTIAADVINGSGFKLSDFESAGLDDYDLREIRKLFRYEAPLRRRGNNPLSRS